MNQEQPEKETEKTPEVETAQPETQEQTAGDTAAVAAATGEVKADEKKEKVVIGRKKSKKKIIIPIVIGVAVIAGVAFFLLRGGSTASEETATAEYMDVYKQLEFAGDVAPAENRAVYSVVNQVKISEVCVDNGDFVHEGDALVKLDSTSLEFDIKTKELALEQAKVDQENDLKSAESAKSAGTSESLVSKSDMVKSAQADFDSIQAKYNKALADYNNDNTAAIITAKATLRSAQVQLDILDQDDFNQRSVQGTAVCNAEEELRSAREQAKNEVDTLALDLEKAQIALDNAKAEYSAASGSAKSTQTDLETRVNKLEGSTTIEQAEVELDKLKSDLENYTIKAQCDGYISGIAVKVGDTSDSKQMMSIMDYSSMKVVFDVDEYDIGAFKLGDPVSVYVPSQEAYYDGEVESIATEATKKNDLSYIKVTVSFSPDVMISSGLGATVSTVPGEDANQVAVPASMVQTDMETGESYVMVKNGDTTEQRMVTVGDSNDEYTAILDGLAEGETVVSVSDGEQ